MKDKVKPHISNVRSVLQYRCETISPGVNMRKLSISIEVFAKYDRDIFDENYEQQRVRNENRSTVDLNGVIRGRFTFLGNLWRGENGLVK